MLRLLERAETQRWRVAFYGGEQSCLDQLTGKMLARYPGLRIVRAISPPFRALTEEELAWAVRRGDTRLRSVLDATLSHWKREGRIAPIVQRWIPVRVTLRSSRSRKP